MRIATLTAAALIAGATMASAASHSDVDLNNDGKITFNEWDHVYGTEADRIGFNYSDKDGSGYLDLREFINAQATGVLS